MLMKGLKKIDTVVKYSAVEAYGGSGGNDP
jgi:hypothetical protein